MPSSFPRSFQPILCWAIALGAAAIAYFPALAAADKAGRTIDQFAEEYSALSIPPLTLSYVENLEALGEPAALARQREVLTAWQERLRKIDARKLATCDRIDLAKAVEAVDRGIERAALGLEYLRQAQASVPTQGLHGTPMGQEWYAFYLKLWLGADIEPDAVFAFGEREIASARKQHDALQRKMGFEGDDEGLRRRLAAETFVVPDGPEIGALFEAAQKVVRENLRTLFSSDYGVEPAAIRRSDRGAAFAVPGYYVFDERAFYYNVLSETYDTRQVDWLLLHEETPGHHFQLNALATKNACESRLASIRFPAFLEGWGAYAETLGKELGLYLTPESEIAAAEWNLVRSTRVALDVGLNYYGWSDERALKYWRENVRGQGEIAQREIDRMRRWPAQVVTYKYGAHVFERLKAELANGAAGVRAYHDFIIRYGDMPLDAFEDLARETL